jgi:hypothetical protein
MRKITVARASALLLPALAVAPHQFAVTGGRSARRGAGLNQIAVQTDPCRRDPQEGGVPRLAYVQPPCSTRSTRSTVASGPSPARRAARPTATPRWPPPPSPRHPVPQRL